MVKYLRNKKGMAIKMMISLLLMLLLIGFLLYAHAKGFESILDSILSW